MPQTITPAADATTELKIGSVLIRRASGSDPDMATGVPAPQGRISAAFTLRRFAAGAATDGQDVPSAGIDDVDAWVAALAAANDPLAAAAAQQFAAADDALKWLAALRGSQLGLCDRPAQ